jgi:ABC-type lipoprotein export system ATPase subunit
VLIWEGHFVAIVGRSGCGKSTLRGVNQQARIMFQDGRLLPWKTVLENVGLGLRGDWRPKGTAEVLESILHNDEGSGAINEPAIHAASNNSHNNKANGVGSSSGLPKTSLPTAVVARPSG